MALSLFNGAIFVPFQDIEMARVDLVLEGREGTEARTLSTERMQFAEREAEVTNMQITLGEPHFPYEATYACSVADFDGELQMVVKWDKLSDEDVIEEGEAPALPVDNWQNPRDFAELIDLFEELEWKWDSTGRGLADFKLEISGVEPR